MNGDKVFPVYAKVFLSSDYNGLDWGIYFRRFKELKEAGLIDDELPVIKEKKLSQLKENGERITMKKNYITLKDYMMVCFRLRT